MEQVVVWQRMAKRWLEAASEVTVPALKRCCRERAAAYGWLAADAGGRKHTPSAQMQGNGGERL